MPSTVQTIQASCILCLVLLPGCVRTPLSPDPAAFSCPEPSTARSANSQDKSTIQTDNKKNQPTTTIQALQKRLLERERTIAIRDQQIEVLSSQLDALKQIDQDTRRRPLGRLGPSAVAASP